MVFHCKIDGGLYWKAKSRIFCFQVSKFLNELFLNRFYLFLSEPIIQRETFRFRQKSKTNWCSDHLFQNSYFIVIINYCVETKLNHVWNTVKCLYRNFNHSEGRKGVSKERRTRIRERKKEGKES